MEPRTKKSWSDEETQCFLALWSSSEVQHRLEGAIRTKPVFEYLQRKMTAAGYDRSVDQLINKLKKLKKNFRDNKLAGVRSGNGTHKRNPHFDILDFVIGNRAANQNTGAQKPTAASSILLPTVDGTAAEEEERNATESDLMGTEGDENRRPMACNSPAPDTQSCSSSPPSSPCSCRSGKRKRKAESEILEYLQWSEKRLQEDREREERLTSVFVSSLQKMEENSRAIIGLLDRMVSVMERTAPK